MKTSIHSLCHFVNTHRMVSDYVQEFYFRAHDHFRALDADGAVRARTLAAWLERIEKEWQHVRFESVERGAGATLPAGSRVHARVRIQLGALTPGDVVVDLYIGRLSSAGEIVQAGAFPMAATSSNGAGGYTFEVEALCARSGLHGYTIRVRPKHPDLAVSFIPGLICWADATLQHATMAPGR